MDPPPPLRKGTSSAVEILPYFAQNGAPVAIVVIKDLFAVDQRQQVSRVGEAEVRLVDVPWEPDKPETSSTCLPSDLCLGKPSTDVLVIGSATGPGETRQKTLDVFVRVGPIEKTLRVHGTRVWYQGARGLTLSPPEPFDSVPLRWELAFGGSDYSDPKHPLEEARNPVGRGIARQARDLVNQPGPQIEDPRDPIADSRKPAPVGVAPLGRSWEPRRRYVGTYDESWKRNRMPLLPLDFDDRFNQVAPVDQITPAHLRGGELVQLHNLSSHGSLQFELPRLAFFVGARTDEAFTEHKPVMDTVVLLPNARRVELTWRAVVPLPKKRDRLHFIQVHDKRFV